MPPADSVTSSKKNCVEGGDPSELTSVMTPENVSVAPSRPASGSLPASSGPAWAPVTKIATLCESIPP